MWEKAFRRQVLLLSSYYEHVGFPKFETS